jgi:putative nucleotidyltransferase with HDIG domain
MPTESLTATTWRLQQQALSIVRTLRQHGHTAYWAGGCVRDQLLGRSPKDIDIATDATPPRVQALFARTRAMGEAFGVIGVLVDQHLFEVATFRSEGRYVDGRRPESVRYGHPREDALRRDFTVNALFYDPLNDQVIDYVGGRADVVRRCLRTVGEPAQRFAEDHLRMLRAARFAVTLDFVLDAGTAAAIRQQADRIQRISPERIRDELSRMLTEARRVGDAVRLLQQLNLLQEVLPEVAALEGVEQPPAFHPEGDVMTHTCLMLNGLPPTPDLELALMVLLHDIGKPPTAAWGKGADGEERIRFDGHDKVGAEMAERRLRALRYPNAVIDAVVRGVRNHMRFMHVQQMKRSTLRALVGADGFERELLLHRLDCQASHGDLGNVTFLRRFQTELANEPVLPPRWITGHDLQALGIPPGPALGEWLRRCYDRQLEGLHPNRESLHAWVEQAIKDA